MSKKKLITGLIGLIGLIGATKPQSAIASMVPFKSCEQTSIDPVNPDEQHPLRPNPFRNCEDKPVTGKTCDTDLEVTRKVTFPRVNALQKIIGGDPDCNPRFPKPGDHVVCTKPARIDTTVSVDLSQLTLPFMGVTCPDGENEKCLADELSYSKKAEYLAYWLGGSVAENEQNPLNVENENEANRLLSFGGVLKKLIPDLGDSKENLIKKADESKTYDQITCYVQNGKVIDRTIGQEKIKNGESVTVYRLSDLKSHLNNPSAGSGSAMEEPWQTCWEQAQYLQTADLKGELKLGPAGNTLPLSFPHLLYSDQATDVLAKVFVPKEVEMNPPSGGGTCDVKKAIASGLQGDKLSKENTVSVAVSLGPVEATYEYDEPTVAQIFFCKLTGCELPTTVTVPVIFPLPVKLTSPREIAGISEQTAGGIFKAKVPVSEDWGAPIAAPISIDGKAARLAIPLLGGVKKGFDTLQCALNPFKTCTINIEEEPDLDINPTCSSDDPDIFDPLYEPIPPTDPALGRAFVKQNYQDDLHLGSNSTIPSDEALGCMIKYADNHWSGNGFGLRYQDVIKFALENDWNPMFLLSLWVEETHAGADGTGPQLGCGTSQDLEDQFKCLASDPKLLTYKNDPIEDFLCMYAGYLPNNTACIFDQHPVFVKNLSIFYNYFKNR